MRLRQTRRERDRQNGAAMLIAIFALLLISVVAIALVVSQGTDSALAGNYRTSSGGYYAAMAGLEEARGRLSAKNPNCFVSRITAPNCPSPTFIPMNAGYFTPAFQLTDVRYILNPANGETVDPTSSNPTSYPDKEYQQEFGWSLSGANVQTIASMWSTIGINGPAYKWVRINPVTEQALNQDVNGDGIFDNTTALLYDPANLDISNNLRPGARPNLVLPPPPCPFFVTSTSNCRPTAVQALEITSLSVMPNGSQRMLQYVVVPYMLAPQLWYPSPSSWNPPPQSPTGQLFPAALTLAGNGVIFNGPGTANFYVNGKDPCGTSPNDLVYSIGYTNTGDGPSITPHAVPSSRYLGAPQQTGAPAPPPSTPSNPGIGNIDQVPAYSPLIRPNWLTPIGLDGIVQDVTKAADVVFTGPVTASASLTPLSMTPNNPMTIVVNGDFDFTGWHHTGYGILLVTGNLTYDPDATWEGLILVIGQGNWVSTRSGIGGVDGAVFIAKTHDASGNLLSPSNLTSSLGPASFSQTGSGSAKGINYNSCWLNGSATGPGALTYPLTYKVLSFREIPLN